jgi:hypothetical protein
LTSYLIV